jgi:hypothetical protein
LKNVAGEISIIRKFVTCKEGEMVGACSTSGRYEKYCRVSEENCYVKKEREV